MPALDEKPELLPDVEWLWDAYWALDRSRPVGFGPAAVPLTAVESYARLFGVADVAALVQAVAEMDAAYLRFHSERQRHAEKQKAGRPQAEPARKPNRRHGHR